MVRWKVEEIIDRYTLRRSTSKKVREKIDTNLETISNKVLDMNINFISRLLLIDYRNLEGMPKFWRRNNFGNPNKN